MPRRPRAATEAHSLLEGGEPPSEIIVLRAPVRTPEHVREARGMLQNVDNDRLAIECRWLRRTIDSSRLDPYVMLCNHIVREGKDCIGPFLENLETNCGLWDPNETALARIARRAAR